MGVRPNGQGFDLPVGQCSCEHVRPVKASILTLYELLMEYRPPLIERPLKRPNHCVDVGNSTEGRVQRAVERDIDELGAGSTHSVAMSVERAVQQDIAGNDFAPAAVTRLVTGTADQQRSVGAKMMMALERAAGRVPLNLLPWEDQSHQLRFKSGATASSVIIEMASSTVITSCRSSDPRRRSATVPSSASRLPTTSSSGTFFSECSRTL